MVVSFEIVSSPAMTPGSAQKLFALHYGFRAQLSHCWLRARKYCPRYKTKEGGTRRTGFEVLRRPASVERKREGTWVRAEQISSPVERLNTIVCSNSHRGKGYSPRGMVLFASAAPGREEKGI
jgi:hypothetical protein